ncbi:MAG: Flp pilus assembly protein CpaB [Pseudomonadota bacterium]
MRVVFGLVLVVGLGLAGFAVYMAQEYIGANREALERERAARAALVPLVEVFVVNRTIKYGEQLSKDDVKLVRFPENAVPDGVFRDPANLFPGDGSDLRTVLRTIDRNEALSRQKVTDPGEIAGVGSLLEPGERAFTIRVDVTSGVSGFLRPGNNVDVYWSGRSQIGDITKLIESAVRIIAIDQSANSELAENRVARTVTVAVSPIQVAALAQAQATGRLSLSLVGSGDTVTTETTDIEINQRELLGIKEAEVVEVEEQRVCTIKTRRGGEVVEVPIDCPNG